MTGQTISNQPPFAEELTSESVDAQPDRRRRTASKQPSAGRQRGLGVGCGVAEPPAQLFAGHPRGQVVGRRIGESPARLSAGRPRGQVVGPRVGQSPQQSFAGRPRGHILG